MVDSLGATDGPKQGRIQASEGVCIIQQRRSIIRGFAAYVLILLSLTHSICLDGLQAPKLFSGLCFCLSDFMNPGNRDRMRDLIAAAGGRMLEKRDLHSLLLRISDGHHSSSSVKKPRPCYYFVYDADAPRRFRSRSLWKEMEEAREQTAAGAQLIGHLRVLDAVAAYDAEILRKQM